MNCNNCGKELIEGSLYCKYCGARQTQVEPNADKTVTDAPSESSPDVQTPKSNPQKTIIIVLSVVLAISVIVAVIIIAPKLFDKSKDIIATTDINTSLVTTSEVAESVEETDKSDEKETRQNKETTKSISKAYADAVEEYENRYGYFAKTSPYVTGVCWIELLDFDADGTDELFIAYNDNKNSDSRFNYDILAYENGSAKKIATRKLKTDDYDTAKTVEVFIEEETSKLYIYEIEDYDYESVDGSLFTKSGNDLVDAYAFMKSESMYRLNGDWYDDDEFGEMFSFYTMDIGYDDTDRHIADTKRMIHNMD